MKNDLISPMSMTVKELAESLKVDESTIRRYVKKLFPDFAKNGVKTYISELMATKIKLELERNKHLGSDAQLPKTDLEKKLLIQQAMMFLNEEVEELKQKIESQSIQLTEAQPAIEFHGQVEASINSISVAEFANMLTKNGFKIGQNKLFRWFYAEKYLINSSRPYQNALDSGWFEVKKLTYKDTDENERTAHKILVTGKGQTYFTKKIVSGKT